MFNIHTEVPSGAASRGYDYDTEDEALMCFNRVKGQLELMGFVGDLIVEEGGIELQREAIPHVA